MAKIKLERTVYRGVEGSFVEVGVIASGLANAQESTISELDKCTLRMVPSSFFHDQSITFEKDLAAQSNITFSNVDSEGNARGTARIELIDDGIAENVEGGLIVLSSSSPKKIRPTNPVYAIILIEDKTNPAKVFFNSAETQLIQSAPEERTSYAFGESFVVNIDRSRFVDRAGWRQFLSSPISVYHQDGTKSVAGFFSDLFQSGSDLFSITVYKPDIKDGGLFLDYCRRAKINEDVPTLIYWETVSEEELKAAAEASGYTEWGEFGHLFGGKSNPRREIRKRELSLASSRAKS